MYRKLEIIHLETKYESEGEEYTIPPFKGGILGAYYSPWWTDILNGPQGMIPQNALFFFTEKGWREVGRHVVAESKKAGQTVRVIAVKESSVNVVWGDDFEVAAQHKKPRSRKKNWFY